MPLLQTVLLESVALMGTQCSHGTMEVYVAAVAQRFAWLQWGDIREGQALKDLLVGIERWWGKGRAKIRPVEARHIAALLQLPVPRDWVYP